MKMTTKELNQAVLKFNTECPEGTEVIVTLDDGSTRKTQTTSEAWILGGHTAVVLLDGISGCYLLSRVVKA